MDAIANAAAIVDRRRLDAKLRRLAETEDEGDRRRGLLEILREARIEGGEEIRRRFKSGRRGAEAARSMAHLTDQILRSLYVFVSTREFPAPNPTAGERLCLVAVGGYGRGEMAPFSDIDILFLLPYKLTPHGEQVVEYMLYVLWDLGYKVGHATRTIDECLRLARRDHTIRTSLLEARHIWGDKAPYNELRERFRKEVMSDSPMGFVAAKLEERDARHRRLGDSRYFLEPNIKDGKGGLRDLHTLFWIAKHLYFTEDIGGLVKRGVFTKGEAETFARAHNFLWTLRFHLHYVAGRAEERLTFNTQPEIATRMSYKDHAGSHRVERFMKHYYLTAKAVGDLTRIFCAAIESEHKRRPLFSLERLGIGRKLVEGFAIQDGRLVMEKSGAFAKDPVNLIRIFRVAQENDLDIHPRTLRQVTRNLDRIDQRLRRNKEANRLFLEIIKGREPEKSLRRLNEAGVFGRFIPDFGRIIAQMQHDMYHVFTVDEHTIQAIGNLYKIEKGLLKGEHPLATELMSKVLSRRVLYLALLFHDIAKGRGGNHSDLGARVAIATCRRFGLPAEEIETIAWLVQHHLIFSDTAQRRDIADPKTIADFVEIVQSPERLRLLAVLTVADMRATGPTVWNAWKAALLRELYESAEDVMSGGTLTEKRRTRVAIAQKNFAVALAERPDWSEAEIDAHIERCDDNYWLVFDTPTHIRQATQIREAEAAGEALSIAAFADPTRAVTEITVYTADYAGLFSDIAGAMVLNGAEIVDARIFTLGNGMALDNFWVQNARRMPVTEDGLARLKTAIGEVLTGRLRLKPEMVKPAGGREREVEIAPRVLIDNKASNSHTVVEVNARDRPGLLWDITRALRETNVQISRAKVSTFGARAVDVFYVKDLFGLKIENDNKIESIRAAVAGVLESATSPGKSKETSKGESGRGSGRQAAKSATSRRRATPKAETKRAGAARSAARS